MSVEIQMQANKMENKYSLNSEIENIESTLTDLSQYIHKYGELRRYQRPTQVQETNIENDEKVVREAIQRLKDDLHNSQQSNQGQYMTQSDIDEKNVRINNIEKQFKELMQNYERQRSQVLQPTAAASNYTNVKQQQGASSKQSSNGKTMTNDNYPSNEAKNSGSRLDLDQYQQQRGYKGSSSKPSVVDDDESQPKEEHYGQQALELLQKIDKDDQQIKVVANTLNVMLVQEKQAGKMLDQQIKETAEIADKNEKTAQDLKKANDNLEKLIDWVKKSELGLYILIFTLEMCLGIVLMKMAGKI